MDTKITEQQFDEILSELSMTSNPDDYAGHENFIAYMKNPNLSGYSNWQFANGYNLAITAIRVKLREKDILI